MTASAVLSVSTWIGWSMFYSEQKDAEQSETDLRQLKVDYNRLRDAYDLKCLSEKKVDSAPLANIPFPRGFTLEKWRENPPLHQDILQFSKKPTFEHMLAVLHNEVPRSFGFEKENYDATKAAIDLGYVKGYQLCLSMIEFLLQPPSRSAVEVESTFEKPEEDQNT